MEILVFKTSIRYKKNISYIMPHFEKFEGIKDWNVDLKDRDKILRVKALNVLPSSIERLVKNAGFYCDELPD